MWYCEMALTSHERAERANVGRRWKSENHPNQSPKKQIKAMLTSVTNVASEHRKVPGIGVWGCNLVCRNIRLTSMRTRV